DGGGGQGPFAREAAEAHVVGQPWGDWLEKVGKCDGIFVFGAFAHLAEARVVAILLAAPGIAPGGLNMSVGKRADPDVGPCRWDGERLDPPENVSLGQPRAIGAGVGEGPSRLFAAGARAGSGDGSQS